MLKRRFGLKAIFFLTTVAALASVAIVSRTEFSVVALVRVRHRPDVPIGQNYDFRGKQNRIIERFRAKQALESAVSKALGDASRLESIRSRLEIRRVGYTEIVSITLRGRRFRDSQSKFLAVVQELLEERLANVQGTETEVLVVQAPTIHG